MGGFIRSKQCSLCGQHFNNEPGLMQWSQVRAKVFDGQGRHVVGFAPGPVTDWNAEGVACVFCLANLGIMPDPLTPPASPQPTPPS